MKRVITSSMFRYFEMWRMFSCRLRGNTIVGPKVSGSQSDRTSLTEIRWMSYKIIEVATNIMKTGV